MSVRICQSCGAEVPEGVRFCPKCGKEVALQVCQACGAEVPVGAGFCPKCEKKVISAPPPLLKRQAEPRGRHGPVFWVVLIVVVGFVIFIGYKVLATKPQMSTGPLGGTPPSQTSTPVETQKPVETQQPTGKAISATENAALWAKAHTALAQFMGEGFKTFGDEEAHPATQEELAPLSRSINDFNKAVKAIEAVAPPPEQVIEHRALLPIYQEMQGRMVGIRDALLSGDPWKADLEWHRLALLLDKAGGVSEVLRQ